MENADGDDGLVRCAWALREPDRTYHDREWGVPVHDDPMLFEMLVLEGAQAGLSWTTILRRRNGYRAAFAQFDPAAVAAFSIADVERLVLDPRIVRHRGKIEATVRNAAAFLAVAAQFGSFAAFLWAYVEGVPVVTRRALSDDAPATTPLAQRLSADLKRRGFSFVGPTIVYAFLQACGVVDDHRAECFRAAIVDRG